jgi:hypothetical protein
VARRVAAAWLSTAEQRRLECCAARGEPPYAQAAGVIYIEMPGHGPSQPELLHDVRAALASQAQFRGWHCVLALPCGRRASGADSLASLLGGKPTTKRRLVALALRPVEGEEPGGPTPWKAALHVLKAEARSTGGGRPESSTLTVTDSFKLKALARLEGGAADVDGKCREAVLVFDAALGRHKETLSFEELPGRTLLLGALWHLATEAADGAAPVQLSGLATSDMRAWADKAKRSLLLPTKRTGFFIPDEHDDVDDLYDDDDASVSGTAGGEPGGSSAQGAGQAGEARLVTEEEASALQQLLDSYRLDVGDATLLEERLRKEAAALEASNVHALLEAEADLAAVMRLLHHSRSDVDDLTQWLDVFNVKLVHMRADIAAIERRNSRLNKKANNNAAVLGPLEKLVEALTLPPGLDRALAGPLTPLAEARSTVRAARDLRAAIDALAPAQLVPGAEAMRAVKEHRALLAKLRGEFVVRAGSHVQRAGADAIVNAATLGKRPRDGATGLPRLHDTSSSRQVLRDMQPLIRCVTALDGEAGGVMRGTHVNALGATLRKALRDLVAAAKQAVKDAGGDVAGSAAMTGSSGPTPGRAFCGACLDGVQCGLDEVQFLGELHSPEEGGSSTSDDASSWAAAGLSGVAAELVPLGEWVAKTDPPALVACIGALGRAAAACTDRGPQCGGAAMVSGLVDLQSRLHGAFTHFTGDRAAALSKSGDASTSGLSSFLTGVKTHELLPEVAKTLPLLQRLEQLASEPALGFGNTKQQPRGARQADDGRREAVDAAYGTLLPALFSYIDRAAAADRDHLSEVRLRSYTAVADALSPLLRGSSKDSGAPLSQHLQAASEAAEAALEAYADDMLSRSLPVPLDILRRIEAALATGMAPDAVAFQAGLARSDVRRALKDALASPKADKAVQDVYARVAKHFRGVAGAGRQELFDAAWQGVGGRLVECWARLEGYVGQLYNDSLAPSAAAMEDLVGSMQ